MRLLLATLALAITVAVWSNVAAASVVWDGYTLALTPAGTWTSAEQYAESQGGHLVSIESLQESDFIYDNFLKGSAQEYWIGLHCPVGDYVVPANWSWADGSAVTFTNWRGGQPDGGTGSDRFAGVNYVETAQWDNYPDNGWDGSKPGIFEVATAVPEPSTLVIWSVLGGCGIAVARWRKRKAA